MIERHKREGDYSNYTPRLQLIVRDDDHAVIEGIRATVGIGWVVRRRSSGGKRGQIGWIVSKKADLAALVRLLDAYPLKSKKARDYTIWRQAVNAWLALMPTGWRGAVRHDWTELARLYDELRAVRAYD